MRDERTLTGRVERIEGILGLGEDEMLTEGLARLGETIRDEGDTLGVAGQEDYRTAQRGYNEHWSKRVHAERASLRDEKTEAATSFEEIVQRIQGSTDRILHLSDKLEKIGDRIMGTLPEEKVAGLGEDQRAPQGTLEHTFMALNLLDGAISRLQGAALRLDRV